MNKKLKIKILISKKFLFIIFVSIILIALYVFLINKIHILGQSIGYKDGYKSVTEKKYFTAFDEGYKKGLEDLSVENWNNIYNCGIIKGEECYYESLKKKSGSINVRETISILEMKKSGIVDRSEIANFMLERDGKENLYKLLNICKNENCNIISLSGTHYCGIHKCNVNKCNSSIMRENMLYCNEHKCIISECNNKGIYPGTFCEKHKK